MSCSGTAAKISSLQSSPHQPLVPGGSAQILLERRDRNRDSNNDDDDDNNNNIDGRHGQNHLNDNFTVSATFIQ